MADLSDSVNWSEVDATNNKASPLGWPEGMMPSGVNDSARADKGALKRFWDRINPVEQITPSGGVWTFTTANPAYPAAYVNGEVYCFWPLLDSAAGDQFQVNALAAKPIWKRIDTGTGYAPVAALDIVQRLPATLVYDSTLNGGAGAFMLGNPFVPLTGDGAGGISAAGPIFTTGASAGLSFAARDGAAPTSWIWYATGGLARLNAAGPGDRVTVDAGGTLAAAGEIRSGSNINSGNDLHLTGYFILFAGNTSLSSGPLIEGTTADFYTRLGPGNGGWYWQNSAAANVMTLTSGGTLTASNAIFTTGANAGLVFYDRGNSAASWIWYANGGGARLNLSGAADQAVFDSLGAHLVSNLYLGGTEIFLNGATTGAGPYIVADATNFSLACGPGNGGFFFDKSGGATVARIDGNGNIFAGDIHAGGNVFLTGTQIFFNGNTTGTGPYIAADSANISFTLGPGGGGFYFNTTGGTNRARIDAAGSIYCGPSVFLTGTQIFFNGNASTAQGPFIYGDANDFIFNIGSNTGSWRFENNSRTQVAHIDAGGDIHATGALRGGNGASDAGVLRGMPTADPTRHTISFGWDAVNSVFYRIIDNARTDTLIWSDTIRAQILAADGGTPSGWHLSVFSGGTTYAIYVDFTASDARMKRGIADSKVDALAAICAVPVRRFEWRKEVQSLFGVPQGPVAIGLVAQDMLEHMPDCVGVSEGREKPYPADTHTIMHERIDAYLIRAIQQLAARVAQLEAK